jgi:hypothetical protein
MGVLLAMVDGLSQTSVEMFKLILVIFICVTINEVLVMVPMRECMKYVFPNISTKKVKVSEFYILPLLVLAISNYFKK